MAGISERRNILEHIRGLAILGEDERLCLSVAIRTRLVSRRNGGQPLELGRGTSKARSEGSKTETLQARHDETGNQIIGRRYKLICLSGVESRTTFLKPLFCTSKEPSLNGSSRWNDVEEAETRTNQSPQLTGDGHSAAMGTEACGRWRWGGSSLSVASGGCLNRENRDDEMGNCVGEIGNSGRVSQTCISFLVVGCPKSFRPRACIFFTQP